MKLSIQYTSEVDKILIKEAAKLKNEEDAKKQGWLFIGSGVYKNSYKKGEIVVKFNKNNSHAGHMINEMDFYRKTSKRHKKHLARIFGGNKSLIIQRLVRYDKNIDYDGKLRDEMYNLGKKLDIRDFAPGFNVVKSKDGEIVFYDFGGQMFPNNK